MNLHAIVLVGIGILTGALTYWTYVLEKPMQRIAQLKMVPISIPMPSMFKESITPKLETRIERPIKKNAPLSGSCNNCQKAVPLPFVCKFCDSIFCSEHRLPENHSCTAL